MKTKISYSFSLVLLLSLMAVSGCTKKTDNRGLDFAKQFEGTYEVVTTTPSCPPVTHLITLTVIGDNKLSIYNLGNSSSNSSTDINASADGLSLIIEKQHVNSEHFVWGTGELSSDNSEIAIYYTAKNINVDGMQCIDKGRRIK